MYLQSSFGRAIPCSRRFDFLFDLVTKYPSNDEKDLLFTSLQSKCILSQVYFECSACAHICETNRCLHQVESLPGPNYNSSETHLLASNWKMFHHVKKILVPCESNDQNTGEIFSYLSDQKLIRLRYSNVIIINSVCVWNIHSHSTLSNISIISLPFRFHLWIALHLASSSCWNKIYFLS